MLINTLYLDSPIGGLVAQSTSFGIKSLQFLTTKNKEQIPTASDCPFLNQLQLELGKYMIGKLRNFSVSLDIAGTEFQKKVWQELLEIPYGKTVSYKQIAQKIGNENASRAVGNANHQNKIMILIPCHRVVGKNNHLVGYAAGIDKKKWLLEREQV